MALDPQSSLAKLFAASIRLKRVVPRYQRSERRVPMTTLQAVELETSRGITAKVNKDGGNVVGDLLSRPFTIEPT